MKICNLSTDDYANFAYENAKALRSIGVDCKDFKTTLHPFNYDSQSEIIPNGKIIEMMRMADIIQIFHSDSYILRLLKTINYKGKKIIVYHTGSRYRGRPDFYNKEFNFVDLTFTDQCEFMELGAKNIHYVATAIDAKAIESFGHELKYPYKIGHFPSNAEVKGTRKILEMLTKISSEFKLNYSVEVVSHQFHLKRMNDCDIYIELFKPELNDKPYGCFGVTAFEAAAAGKIVVTQNINEKAYENAYGYCPFIICNNENDFMKKVNELLLKDKLEISTLQTQSYEWVKGTHSYEATGKYIWNKLQAL